MRVIDILEAEENLSDLVDEAAQGNSFVISVDGKSLVRVEPLSAADLAAIEKRSSSAAVGDNEVT